jgi:hypothetical protein
VKNKRKPGLVSGNLGRLWSLRTIKPFRDLPSTKTEFSEKKVKTLFEGYGLQYPRTHRPSSVHPATISLQT